MELTRRQLVRYGAAAGFALFAPWQLSARDALASPLAVPTLSRSGDPEVSLAVHPAVGDAAQGGSSSRRQERRLSSSFPSSHRSARRATAARCRSTRSIRRPLHRRRGAACRAAGDDERDAERAPLAGCDHRKPGGGRLPGVGDVQPHRGRPPDPCPRGPVPGRRSRADRWRPGAAPESWETGFKDTVIAYPGEITRIKARFGVGGLFVWHCHIVEHEGQRDDAPVLDRADAVTLSAR